MVCRARERLPIRSESNYIYLDGGNHIHIYVRIYSNHTLSNSVSVLKRERERVEKQLARLLLVKSVQNVLQSNCMFEHSVQIEKEEN